MNIVSSALELIGNTPLIRFQNLEKEAGAEAVILGKLESKNPGGSAKDRIALHMIEKAEASGILKKGSVIIEPTSGNTGIGLAMVGAAKGYRVIIVMPDSMSIERIKLMQGYGAEVVLTPGAEGMKGSIAKANEIAATIPGSFIPGQFANPDNPESHYLTTGPEIWRDTDGKVDVFIAGIGTGGTISGTGRYLKEMNPSVRIIGIEPAGSPLLTKGYSGSHDLQGIGANFIPDALDTSIYDEVFTVTDEEAYEAARLCGAREGLLVGITSGASLHVAMMLSKDPAYKGKNIVAFLTDTGDHYLSTKLFK